MVPSPVSMEDVNDTSSPSTGETGNQVKSTPVIGSQTSATVTVWVAVPAVQPLLAVSVTVYSPGVAKV